MGGAGHVQYFVELQREDYFTKGGEPAGQWFGSGAAQLGLRGKVEKHVIRELFDGRMPNSKLPLTQQQTYSTIHQGCGKIRSRQITILRETKLHNKVAQRNNG